MGKNVGSIDRVARIVVGLILLALVFVGPQTPWGWVGLIPLATGLISWCPLYAVLGFNTCPVGGKAT
jgi:phosphatidylglycerophosphate synthase